MKVCDALAQRKSVRAYLDRPVAQTLIEQLLETASHAPSGANTQPWQVAVVSGATKARLASEMRARFQAGERGAMDYHYYPEQWFEPYNERRFACGQQLYQALGIGRSEKQRRLDQWAANYDAFGAPVMLFFFLDRRLEQGSLIDFGLFLQSLMLAAVEAGLGCCAQAALAGYPDLVRAELGYGDDQMLLCGMALGYEDTLHPVNHYRTPREPVAAFTRFFA